MRFQILSAVVAALTVSTASAQLSPQQVVDTIKKVTDLSSSTAEIAEDLGSNPVTLIPNGFKLVDNFRKIISTVTGAAPMLEDKPKDEFPVSGQTDICEGFREFVRVHQRLLNIVIGKDSLLAKTPVASLLAGVLRELEKIVDKAAFLIIDLVPTCAGGAKADLDKLDGTIGKAIDTYS